MELNSLQHKNVNDNIPIYTGDYIIIINKVNLSLNGEIYLEWLPKPKIKFLGDLKDDSYNSLEIFDLFLKQEKKHSIIKVPGFGEEEILINHVGENISGIIKNKLEKQNCLTNKVQFFVANMSQIYGRVIEHNSAWYTGRTIFEDSKWVITIDKRSDSKEIFENLNNIGGYCITYIGKIERKDERTFETKDIEILISALQWHLSFACGRRIGVCSLQSCYNKITWGKYQVPVINSWRNKVTWFCNLETLGFEKMFQALLEKLNHSLWGDVLKQAISWYIESLSDSGLENRIISVQVALEMIAWTYFVADKEIIDEGAFNKLRTSDLLRLLLHEFSIPIVLPDIKEFEQYKKRYKVGTHLFTEYRNSIIHPKKKESFKNVSFPVKWKILQLGIWYLELCILYLLGYNGEYTNRLKAEWDGDSEIVPWMNES